MSIIDNEDEVLHRVRVQLYPNNLPDTEGAYIAHTDNEAERTCGALRSFGAHP
jgi:hypothetical protein